MFTMASVEEEFNFSRHLRLKGGDMFCEGVRIKTIQDSLSYALTQPSPFFMYSKQQFLDNVAAYKTALERCGIDYLLGYSIKANHNPWILRTLLEQGCTAVTVSGHEIRLALSVGLPAERIIVNGNGKLTWEIELAAHNDCLINVDSEFDLRHISQAANRLQKRCRVLLRLNPDINPNVHPYLATGLAASKFGFEESQLDDLLTFVSRDPFLELVGLHCHLGSTIDSVLVFSECLDVMLDMVDSVNKRGFRSIRYINLGGGLGIDYCKHAWRTSPTRQPPPNHAQVFMPSPGDLITKVKDKLLAHQDLCLVLEPGRSLIGSAVSLVTKVIGCKENRDTKYIVVDGAMTEVIRPSLYGSYHHIELIEPVNVTEPLKVTEPLDVTEPLKVTEPLDVTEPTKGTVTKSVKVIQLAQSTDSTRPTGHDGSCTRPTGHDGSCTRPTGHDGSCTRPTGHDARHDGSSNHQNRQKFDVVGPVCECADFLGKDRWLPLPHEGCGLAVFDAGAYCGSMSSNYNMRMRPAEVLVDGDEWQIIRDPDQMQHLLSNYKY